MPQPCIVFDLDDTLYLERDYVRSGFDAVGRWAATALGIVDFSERAWRAFEAGVRGSVFQWVLSEAGRTPETATVAEMVRVYREHSPIIAMSPDSLDCLCKLRDHAFLAVITDGIAGSQHAKCRSLSLPNLVDMIICTGQWGPGYYKPNPYAFNYLQEKVGQSVSRFVYVADNPVKDFQAPIQLGWDAVRIRRPAGLYASREWHGDSAPYAELADLRCLPELLNTLFQTDRGTSTRSVS